MVVPSAPEFVGGLELFFLVTTVGVISAIWVYRDARRRGVPHAMLWAACVGFLFLFYALPGVAALIVYVGLRDTIVEDGPTPEHMSAPSSFEERE